MVHATLIPVFPCIKYLIDPALRFQILPNREISVVQRRKRNLFSYVPTTFTTLCLIYVLFPPTTFRKLSVATLPFPNEVKQRGWEKGCSLH
jgi:hypothetical protein